MESRIGIGYDIHRLVDGRPLFIGGVEIPYIKGLLGHSDGDALLHALCDAILGGLGEGDIGEHFPDTDQRYYGISSVELLKETVLLVKNKGLVVGNIDAVVVAQEPALSPFKKQMQRKIAEIIGIPQGNVNIKAKTNEGLGELGKKEAIAAYAVVMLSEGA
jgi:2-C-methyl-D-erythritol 2,4-cyclodiphosphate synthase